MTKMEKKLSEIMKEMAESIFVRPTAPPSAEAGQAALLFAHLAWNREVGASAPNRDAYASLLEELERYDPNLWSEFLHTDPEALIDRLREYKALHYPKDRRQILVCGTVPPGKIHVEWVYPTSAAKPKRSRARRRRMR